MPEKSGPDLSALAAAVMTGVRQSRRFSRRSGTGENDRPIKYYLGDTDEFTPHDDERSGVVSLDVADTIGWMMPDIMRLFFSGDRIVDYVPKNPDDEEFAEQASDYINHVFLQSCDGYQVAWDAIHDSLLLRNGIIKFWWDDTPEYVVREFDGIDDEQLLSIIENERAEILEYDEEVQQVQAPEGLVELSLHSVKVRYVTEDGRIRIASVPPEEFLIDTRATCIDDAEFIAHRYISTRSDLIEDGYDRDQIEGLSLVSSLETEEERLSREEELDVVSFAEGSGKAMETVEVFEAYLKYDVNDDGIAEWCKVVMAGGSGEDNILFYEEWGDPIPFVDLNPERVPHRFEGRSIYDQTHDIQDVKTVLLRNTLDNIYDAVNPERVAVQKEIINPDALLNPRYGEVHQVKTDINAIRDLPKTFVAGDAFNMLGYWDDVIARRSGVSQHSKAMEAEKLQNQSATASMLTQSQAHSKVELIGRNFANGGFKRLFKGLLRLSVNHQNRPMTVRLRNKWVDINPSQWSPDMDATVNTGLGTGSRERDLSMLFRILEIQEKFERELGPDNPWVKPSQVFNTLEQIVHSAGMSNADMFFTEVSDEDAMKWYQQKTAEQQQQAQEPDPATKALVQIETAKAQARAQEKQAEAMERAEVERQRTLSEQNKLMMEDKMKRDEIAVNAQLEELRVRSQAALKEADIYFDAIKNGISTDSIDPMRSITGVLMDLNSAVEGMQRQSMAKRRIDRDENGGILGVGIEDDGAMLDVTPSNGASSIEEAIATLAKTMAGMQAAMTAKKRVIRDENGRVTGVEPMLN